MTEMNLSNEASAGTQATPSPLPRDRLAGLTGLQILEAMLDGRLPLPPFGVTTNIRPEEVSEGRIVFSGIPSAGFLNPLGTVHGGWVATILDSAMACAIHSLLKPGQIYTTTSFTLNFVRPLMPQSERVRCEGVAVHVGGRFATSEGRLFDAKGKLIAHGTETCLIMSAAGKE